jgi:predicted nucleic acid-binding protein
VKRCRVILDTNVILAAMRSQTGASHRLLLTIGNPRWQSVITPALMYEYEDVARRPGNAPGLSPQEITNILDLIYQQSHRRLVWFSWRPLSPDPGDDAILEAAIAGGCD